MTFLFGRRRAVSEPKLVGERLHDELVATTRQPAFYLTMGVPDTFNGRFDLLVLLSAVVLRHLQRQGERGKPVSQHLVDTMFERFEVAMRELGVSDVGVPKRMKRLAQAFRGRTAAYQSALDAADYGALAEAVDRNVLNGQGRPTDLAQAVQRFDRALVSLDLANSSTHLPALPGLNET